ncbi:MAG: radical SAM protein [Oscillospiraceae bacterium]|nr:radical SAM protein [Oscillospiraceae bacterium]
MLRLNDQVYLVSGAAKDCLYDLSHQKLWHIGKDTSALIRRCVTEPGDSFSNDEQAVIAQLTQADLLTEGCGEIPDIRELRQIRKPRAAWIEVCTVCNLRCIHCYNGTQRQIFMSASDFRQVCEKLADYGIRSVQLIGGEPLCHPDFCNLLQTAKASFAVVELYTNGTLLTDAVCVALRQADAAVSLSVYSYESEMHDAVTGINGSHWETERALSLLRQYGIPHHTNAVRMKHIRIGARGSKPYQLDTRADIVRMSGKGSLSLLDSTLLREKCITKETFRHPLRPGRVASAVSGNPCFSRKIYVAADLNVYPCVMERRIRHGSLRNRTLADVLSPAVLGLNKDQVSGCRDCEFRYACPDCRPDSLSDSPAAKPYYCTYDEQRGIWQDPEAFISALLKESE